MANRRLTMREVKMVLTLHFKAALSWSAATDIDDGILEDRLYPPVADQREGAGPDGSAVARQLARQGVTLKRLWQEWREVNPGDMSDPIWCRQFAAWRPYRDVTMRDDGSAVPGRYHISDTHMCGGDGFVGSVVCRGVAPSVLRRRVSVECALF